MTYYKVGRQENALGWYHSHPGYGCWLSGIDVDTQMLNQQYQEPWLAIVVSATFYDPHGLTMQIDPKRTMSSGRVNLGAFRTYPRVNMNHFVLLCLAERYRITNLLMRDHRSTKLFLWIKLKILGFTARGCVTFLTLLTPLSDIILWKRHTLSLR